MAGLKHLLCILVLLAVFDANLSLNPTNVCLKNCAQCKLTFGSYFNGPKCAESCIKYRGLLMPDCNDVKTIHGFLNKNE
ncbi:hypothetical protein JTE90_014494 [Oedothorax gibbosus]|uniref:Eclosion hormone n=1 Tax=Oedothorax gibbosus TaxID=931172 RepID=A0AAV6VKS4_9ARAC|nr:hypothetical protein JTE90_014494 [Oedothorax gibbosus]